MRGMVDAGTRFIWIVVVCSTLGYANAAIAARCETFEAALDHAGTYANPYRDLSAQAHFTGPDGATQSINMFWDGDTTWRVRFAPDQAGTWTWLTVSTDVGLDGQGGTFDCALTPGHGGIRNSPTHPYRIEHEDGTPFLWFGETGWHYYRDIPEEGLDQAAALHYANVRAAQGFNVIHSWLLSTPGFDSVTSETLNPVFWREVDLRLAHLNQLGVVAGLALAWGEQWATFASDAARRRFARYVVARYSAYNVFFIVSGEWQKFGGPDAIFRTMGADIQAGDPHDRMIAIHPSHARSPDPGTVESFADEPWMSFGDYQQIYEASKDTPATAPQRRAMHDRLLAARDHGKPVINSEYGYYLRDRDGDGLVDKEHSHTRTTFRRASWVLMMAGGYIVSGFGTTYFGGNLDPGPFDVDAAKNADAEHDLMNLKQFFAARKWWDLEPSDTLVGGGTTYCLAETGIAYVVYAEGVTSTSLDLGGVGPASYNVRRYDPRLGTYEDLPVYTGVGPITLTSPDTDDWAYVVERTDGETPVARNDVFSVLEDSQDNSLAVLADNGHGADTDPNGDAISVIAVGVPGAGGSAAVDGSGTAVTYTPASGFVGTETFTYTIADGNGGIASATVSVTVVVEGPVNLPPVAKNDVFTVTQGVGQSTLLVLADNGNGVDSDANGDALAVISVGVPNHGGSTAINAAGTAVLYTPLAGFTGVETFTYTISDGRGGTASATVTVTVQGIGGSGSAYLQSTDAQALVSMEAEHFDANVPQGVDNWVLVSTPVAGYSGTGVMDTVPNNGTNISINYVPNSPRLDYRVEFASTGTHYVWVRGLATGGGHNSLHVGLDGQAVSTSAAIGLAVTSNYVWSSGTATMTVGSTGLHTVNVWMREDGTQVDKIVLTKSASYRPTGVGPSESVRGGGASNQPPIANSQTVATTADTAVAVTLTGSDADGDALTYSVVSGPSDGSLSGTAPNLTYTPNSGFTGSDTFTFRVNDGEVDSNAATVTVNVTAAPANQPPVADDQVVGTTVDTAVSVTLTGSDADGDPLSFGVVTGPSDGSLTGTAPNLTYTPNAGFTGTDAFTFTVNDGEVDSAAATVTINVTASPANQPPIANDQTVATTTDTAVAVTLTGSDGDGDPLTFRVESGPSDGSLTGIPPSLTYIPNPGFSGMDAFTFTVNDGEVDSVPATVTINVTASPANQPPVANDQTVATTADTAVAVTLTGSDGDGDPLTYSVVSGPSDGSLTGTPPNLTYTPNAGFTGTDAITFIVNDGEVDSAPATVTMIVAAANQAPVANDQTVTTTADAAVAITLTGSDGDGDALSYSVVTAPSDGALSGTAPSLTYTPNTGFTGTDTFTFRANDGEASSAAATVTIMVEAPNQPPVANGQTVNTVQGIAVGLTLTGSDGDGDPLTYSVATAPSDGALSGTPPNLTYTPNGGFTGTDTFTFRVNDGLVSSTPAMVTVTVQGIGGSGSAYLQSTDAQALVSMEAEHFDANVPQGVDNWVLVSTPVAGYSGTGVMDTVPNNGTNISINYVPNSPRLDYRVEFASTGTHYVWVRGLATGGGHNSLHVGLDGQAVSTSAAIGLAVTSNYVWSSGTATMTVGSTGLHTVNVWMREDGTQVDKIVLTKSASYRPTGVGPSESVRGGGASNQPPIANSQTVATTADTAVAVTLTGSDADGDALTYSVVSGPSDGSLSGTAPNLTYTPNGGFTGTDAFTFIVNDGQANSAAATVTIIVEAANQVPVADDQAVSTIAEVAVAVTLTATDPDGDPLTYSVVTAPSDGALSGTPPNLTYTPDSGFAGTDAFTFRVNDGQANSAPATVTITVETPNQVPVADSRTVTTIMDTAVAVTLTATDPDGDPLTYSVVSGPSDGSLSGTAPNLTYTPNSGFTGSDTFTFRVNDGEVDSTPATVTMIVTAANQPPVADAQSVTTTAGTAVAVTLTASDGDGDPLTYSVNTGPSDGSLSGTPPDLTYTPNAGFVGTDAFTFIANDGEVDSAPASVTIIVEAPNAPPVANDQTVNTVADTAVAVTLTGSDGDGDSLTYSVETGPSDGSLSGSPPDLTYTPNAGFVGTDAFTFIANDGDTNSAPATVTVIVEAPNAPPVANDQTVNTVAETAVVVTLTGSDADGDALTYSVVTGPSDGSLTGTAPNLTYTPNGGFTGADAFTFRVNDGQVNSGAATVTIIVAAANQPPVADDQTVNTAADTAVAVTLTGSDGDGDLLTYSVETGPSDGTLTGIPPDLTYTPNAGFVGTDAFTFIANDGEVDSAPATVTIIVAAANQPPVAGDQTVNTAADTAVAVTLTGSDGDGDSLTYSVETGPSDGTLTGAPPNLTYTPNTGFVGTDTFTFTVNDGEVDSAPATVTIMVETPNQAPIADDQTVNTTQDSAVGLTLTGSDADGDPLTYSVVTAPSDGALSGTAPGLTYTPNSAFAGTDSFTFRVNDGQANSAAATVTIIVEAANQVPVADDQTLSTIAEVAVAVTLTATDGDGDPLTYSVVTAPSDGALSGTAPNLVYTPDAAFVGTDAFTFTANDGEVDSSAATVTIMVEAPNQVPVAENQLVGTIMDAAVAVTLTASDGDADPLTYSVVTDPSNGALSGTPPDLTYTPNAGFIGTDTFTFRVNDGEVDSDPATVTIIVEAPNHAPIADDQTVNTTQDTAVGLTLTGSDGDGDLLTYSVVTDPSNGALSGIPPNLTYTPNGGFVGSDSLAFTVNDGEVDSTPATVTIIVDPN